MSIPVRPEPDPFSLALGRIEGRLDALEKHIAQRFDAVDKRFDAVDKRFEALEKRLGDFATKAELRVWGSLLVLMVGALLAIVVQHGPH